METVRKKMQVSGDCALNVYVRVYCGGSYMWSVGVDHFQVWLVV